AEDPNERKNSLSVRHPSDQLSTRALPFLQQPLERSLQDHAGHTNRMQQDEKCHARSAKPPVDGHLLTSGYSKGYRLCIPVEQVDVARAPRQRAWRLDTIANVLYAVWGVAGDHAPRRLVVKPKRRNPRVLAVEHPRLAIRSRRWQATEPPSEREAFAQQPGDGRAESELEGATQVGIGEGVDLQHDQPALWRTRTL